MNNKEYLIALVKNYWYKLISVPRFRLKSFAELTLTENIIFSNLKFDNEKYNIFNIDYNTFLICGSFSFDFETSKEKVFFSLVVKKNENNIYSIKHNFNTLFLAKNTTHKSSKMQNYNSELVKKYTNEKSKDIVIIFDIKNNNFYYDKLRFCEYFKENILNKENFFISFFRNIKKNHKKFLSNLFDNLDQINLFELEIKNKNDYYTWFNLTVFPIFENFTASKYVIYLKDISDKKNLEEIVLNQAKRDALTNLLNRKEIEKVINCSLLNNKSSTMLMLDVDNFKLINDIKGHPYGDYFLKTVSTLILKYFKTSKTSRTGGDEFIIFIEHSNIEYIKKQINLMKKELYEMFLPDIKTLNVSLSIGKAIFPLNGKSFIELYDYADSKMYENKKNKKENFVF